MSMETNNNNPIQHVGGIDVGEMKGCPFCGSGNTATGDDLRSDPIAYCCTCGASIGGNSLAMALANWNARADHIPEPTKMVQGDYARGIRDACKAVLLVELDALIEGLDDNAKVNRVTKDAFVEAIRALEGP